MWICATSGPHQGHIRARSKLDFTAICESTHRHNVEEAYLGKSWDGLAVGGLGGWWRVEAEAARAYQRGHPSSGWSQSTDCLMTNIIKGWPLTGHAIGGMVDSNEEVLFQATAEKQCH